MWKKGLSTWEEYRSIISACRDAPRRKAEAHLELNLTRKSRTARKAS